MFTTAKQTQQNIWLWWVTQHCHSHQEHHYHNICTFFHQRAKRVTYKTEKISQLLGNFLLKRRKAALNAICVIKGLYISGHLQTLEFPSTHFMERTEHYRLISSQKGLISGNFIVMFSHKWLGSWLLTVCHKYNCCSDLFFLLNIGHQTSVPISLWLCLSQQIAELF